MNRRHFLLTAPTLAAAPLFAAPVPKKKTGLGMLLIRRDREYSLLSEDGKTEREVSGIGGDEKKKLFWPPYNSVRISPDGNRIAWDFHVPRNGKVTTTLCVRELGGTGWGTEDDSKQFRQPVRWLGNTRLLVGRRLEERNGRIPIEYEVVHATTWKTEPFEQPTEGTIADTSTDGDTWLLCKHKPPALPNGWQGRVWSVREAKGKVTELQNDGDDGQVTDEMALSPDGTAVVYTRIIPDDDTIKEGEHKHSIFMRMLTGEKTVQVDKLSRFAIVYSLCWAPDGKRFAYSWEEYDEKKKVWVPQGIATQNADGSNLTHILKCQPGLKENEGPTVECWR